MITVGDGHASADVRVGYLVAGRAHLSWPETRLSLRRTNESRAAGRGGYTVSERFVKASRRTCDVGRLTLRKKGGRVSENPQPALTATKLAGPLRSPSRVPPASMIPVRSGEAAPVEPPEEAPSVRTTLPPESGLCPVISRFSRNLDAGGNARAQRREAPKTAGPSSDLGDDRTVSSISQKSAPDYAQSWTRPVSLDSSAAVTTSGNSPRRRDASPSPRLAVAPRCWRL